MTRNMERDRCVCARVARMVYRIRKSLNSKHLRNPDS
jgi:hypothetical protein